MKANYEIEAGDVRVIRPLCYAREALTKEFARTNRLPLVNENCPACFEEPKERQRVKKARESRGTRSGDSGVFVGWFFLVWVPSREEASAGHGAAWARPRVAGRRFAFALLP